MSATILYGKPVSDALLKALKKDIELLDPKLVIVQVGNDPASTSYIAQKMKSCAAVSMRYEHKHLPEDTSLEALLKLIDELNFDEDTTGFIVQLPLPPALQEHQPLVLRAIDPKKDIDGFGAYNLGKVLLSKEFEHLPPATPAGVISLLKYYSIDVAGRHAVVVGRSSIVGKPLSLMLLNRDATVTVCHSRTADLATYTRQADLLFCAVGKPEMIEAGMVKPGAVVIDIGVSRTEKGLVGDVAFDTVKEVASAISPVPGGVGPLTVASLIQNCVTAKKRQLKAG